MKCEEFYKNYFGIESPYEYQVKVWDGIYSLKYPLLIKAPTGSGKTEAVLAPFLSQFINNSFSIAPRLIYLLPMRVLVNNVAQRIKKYCEKVSPYISVEIQHGDLPSAPFFIADIIVTTLDQFLYGFARASKQVGRHIDVPAGAIASSMVVFDEAHMYRDEFTFSITRALMEILYKSNIPFVVMTATMPESLDKNLFENISMDSERRIFGDIDLKSHLEITIKEEPLIKNNEVNISDEILEEIKHKKTLIVLNQVGRAQRVYEEIKNRLDLNNGKIVLLHSRFTKSDRERHEKEAVSIIPHKEDGMIIRPEKRGIVVSTQVLEAGIDFSSELLLTELAPADCLVQRAGRCARYEGENGKMIIFPVEDDKGHLPYKKEHLEKALEWLKINSVFNIKDFNQVCFFADQTLDYQANDYEARDTLIDLYECVLYADEKPENIQLREGKPITLVIIDLSIGEGRKKEDRIRNVLQKTNIRANSISVDFKVGWKLLKDGILKYRLTFDAEKGLWDFVETQDISPFNYYLLEKDNYDPYKGVIPDASSFII
ncbi:MULTISPECIES: CRISPR-associated helicase Cas3' [Thermodesulfovibrio]|uniref:CRISPR-associated helicase Cas3 n=1 Tax=Thermodesulfovibrio yellowstonii (strain ATCC 51303 / DSM 11347 / YP87) TaxID=289376 RepID=B5YKZ7_THEYD|nr:MULTISPECIES: CRISPR-associated helicase Cas3' [Thermodesulfovibrio]ACI20900.1 CRISPR-associated helicase Cas3 [Thermodesulfovibrio yellowstonii DSM 11347]MDI6864145.1 CRISPR-associated helicase Cas3' [Thermodesulfovibrio yellowstonii]